MNRQTIRAAFAMGFLFTAAPALAEETVPEKAEATKNDVKRAVKKAAHRVEEAVCAESDAKCLAKKAKNRGKEAVEATSDKAAAEVVRILRCSP